MTKRLWGYSFHSVKGGVGKSTLAVHWALHLARSWPQMPVYLLDMDLTGTSLGDVLPLHAPRWTGEGEEGNPVLCLRRPADGWLERQYVQDRMAWRDEYLRGAAQEQMAATHVPFLNDYLLFHPSDWRNSADLDPRHLSWRLEDGPGDLRVFPSSALPKDVERIVPVVFDEYYAGFLEGRCESLLDTLVSDSVEDVAVVVDAPPTIPGLSRAVISLGLRLERRPSKLPLAEGGTIPPRLEATDVSWRAALVTTPDLQDIRAAARWYEYTTREERDTVRLLLNRMPTGNPDQAAAQAKRILTDALRESYPLLGDMDPLWVQDDLALQNFRRECPASSWSLALPGLSSLPQPANGLRGPK